MTMMKEWKGTVKLSQLLKKLKNPVIKSVKTMDRYVIAMHDCTGDNDTSQLLHVMMLMMLMMLMIVIKMMILISISSGDEKHNYKWCMILMNIYIDVDDENSWWRQLINNDYIDDIVIVLQVVCLVCSKEEWIAY